MAKRKGTEKGKREFLRSISIFTAAGIARNDTIYQKFMRTFPLPPRAYQKALKEHRYLYERSRFFMSMTQTQSLRAYRVFCLMTTQDDQLANEMAAFVRQSFPRLASLIEAGHTRDIALIDLMHERIGPEGSIGLAMTLSAFVYMSKGAGDIHMDDNDAQEIRNVTEYIRSYAEPVSKKTGGRRIPPEEKRFAQVLRQKRLVNDYIPAAEIDDLEIVLTEIGSCEPVLYYELTDKDCDDLARNLYVSARMKEMTETKQNADKPPVDLFAPVKNQADRFQSLLSDTVPADKKPPSLSHVVLAYVMGKMRLADRMQQLDEIIRDIDTTEKDDFVPRTELSRVLETAKERERELDQKQEELNALQLKLDKMQEEISELQDQIHEKDEQADAFQTLVDTYTSEETPVQRILDEKPPLPENAILIGGHPNWQKKIREIYPDLRIIDPDNNTFSIDRIRNAELVLLNVTHMSHKQYYRIMPAIRQYDIPIKYIR